MSTSSFLRCIFQGGSNHKLIVLMLDVVLQFLPSLIHTSIHLRDLFQPTAICAQCPDCVCSALALEPIQALTSALQFAQQQCSATPTSTTTTSAVPIGSSWPYSLIFWLGFTVGTLCCLVLLCGIRFCARLIAPPQRSPVPAGALAAKPIFQAILTEGEPATPATLRQLGLLK